MKKILINKTPWQTRIAITHNNELENIFFWSHSSKILERSYFKGIVTKVLPGIQTAFVDIGQSRAGFLHISEIDRDLSLARMISSDQIDDPEFEDDTKKSLTSYQPDIAKIFKEGEEILVQVSKEPVYEKGPKLTTCYTIPGRFLVLMPNVPRIGISKKIESREERQRLKELLIQNLPEGMGVIVRTTSEFQDIKRIKQDLNYLLETWNTIQSNFENAKPKEKVYEDIDISLQVIRDHLDDNTIEVISDDKDNQNTIYKFVKKIAPEDIYKIKYYEGSENLFEKYNIEKQIDQALKKKVNLKSGGSIIIETAEAMTVIDVNTGRYIGKADLEETILKTNREAAEEITRQLKLRNIGGLIVIDFIDMTNPENKQNLFSFFEKNLKERDKFQAVLLKISEFGLVQMTRKRSGKTLIQQLLNQCEACNGLGLVKSIQNESFSILRHVNEYLEQQKNIEKININVNPSVFNYLTNIEYNSILYLEKTFNTKITLVSQKDYKIDAFKIEC